MSDYVELDEELSEGYYWKFFISVLFEFWSEFYYNSYGTSVYPVFC